MNLVEPNGIATLPTKHRWGTLARHARRDVTSGAYATTPRLGPRRGFTSWPEETRFLALLPLDGTHHNPLERLECAIGSNEVILRVSTGYGRGKTAVRFDQTTFVDPALGAVDVLEVNRNVSNSFSESIERKAHTTASVLFDGFRPSGAFPTNVDVHMALTHNISP